MAEQHPPVISAEQARAALVALGLGDHDGTMPSGPAEQTFLLGALLAIVETATYKDLDSAQLPALYQGYLSVLYAVSGQDAQVTARAWSLMLHDRLNRTVADLQQATGEDGRVFIDVAGPAALVAANLLNILNHGAPTSEFVSRTVAAAEHNLITACRQFDQLKEILREQDSGAGNS